MAKYKGSVFQYKVNKNFITRYSVCFILGRAMVFR